MTQAPPPLQIIQAYGNGGFTTSGVHHDGSIVVWRDKIAPWSPPEDLSALSVADFQPVMEGASEIDIVLLGCGARGALVPSALRGELRAAGLTLESMDTGAACRTFNLLQMEGRRVAAMLVAIS